MRGNQLLFLGITCGLLASCAGTSHRGLSIVPASREEREAIELIGGWKIECEELAKLAPGARDAYENAAGEVNAWVEQKISETSDKASRLGGGQVDLSRASIDSQIGLTVRKFKAESTNGRESGLGTAFLVYRGVKAVALLAKASRAKSAKALTRELEALKFEDWETLAN